MLALPIGIQSKRKVKSLNIKTHPSSRLLKTASFLGVIILAFSATYMARASVIPPVVITPGSTVPDAPAITSSMPGINSADIFFTTSPDGGMPITDYLYSTDNGATFTSSGSTTSPIVIGGLIWGPIYMVQIEAVNAVGHSLPSNVFMTQALMSMIMCPPMCMPSPPTPTPTPSGSPSPSFTPSPSPSPSVTPSPTPSPSVTPSPSPSATPYVIPDPVQQSKIISITPSAALHGTATRVVVSGSFVETISNVAFAGKILSVGSWTQTPTTVTFTVPGLEAGNYSVELYNGAVPLLTPLEFTFTISEPESTPTPTISPTPTVSPSPTISATPTPTPTKISCLDGQSLVNNVCVANPVPTPTESTTAVIQEVVGKKKVAPNQIAPISQTIHVTIPNGIAQIRVFINGAEILNYTSTTGDITLPTIVGPNDKITVIVEEDNNKSTTFDVKLPNDPISLANVNFAFDSHTLNHAALEVLDNAVKVIKEHGYTKVSLFGYTDSQGSELYNKQLSAERANAVAQYLKKALGAETKVNLLPSGKAADSPVGSNLSVAGQALNRRVEIFVQQ